MMAGSLTSSVALVCLFCCVRHAEAQNESVADQVDAGVIFAPNPPACAAEFGNIVLGLTNFAAGIVGETSLCAGAMGWQGQTVEGDKQRWPSWHNSRGCAMAIMGTLNTFCGITGSALGASFDCFAKNQGCAQTIVGIISTLLNIGSTLIGATATCAPPGSGPPFYSINDQAIAGFNCYRKIWHIIQALTRTAKLIDLTQALCPGPDDMLAKGLPSLPAGPVEGELDEGELGEGELGRQADPSCAVHSACDGLAGLCCPTVDGVMLACCEADANSTNVTLDVWSNLQQQQTPFVNAEGLMSEAPPVEPVERRLAELQEVLHGLRRLQDEEDDQEVELEGLPDHVRQPHDLHKAAAEALEALASKLRPAVAQQGLSLHI